MARMKIAPEILLRRMFPSANGRPSRMQFWAVERDGTLVFEVSGAGIPRDGDVTCIIHSECERYTFEPNDPPETP